MEEQKGLTPAEYRVGQRLAVCFMVPLGSNLLQSPDNRDNNIKGGTFSWANTIADYESRS